MSSRVLPSAAFLLVIFSLSTALLYVVKERAGPAEATSPPNISRVAVDMKTVGTPAPGPGLGPNDVCTEINANGVRDADEYAVDRVAIDVTAAGIPAGSSPGATGMIGFSYNLNFPDTAVRIPSPYGITDVPPDGVDRNGILSIGMGYAPRPVDEPFLPLTTSPFPANMLDTGGPGVTGSGFLYRFALETKATAVPGRYPVFVTGFSWTDTNGVENYADSVVSGVLAIDSACPVPTDVKTTGSVVTVPPLAHVNVPFDVTVDGTVHNNGGFNPVNTDVQVQLNLPVDCTAAAGSLATVQDLSLAVSNATAVPTQSFSVTCSEPSFHEISATVTATIDDPSLEAVESTPGNNSLTSAAGTVPVEADSDFKSSGVSVTAPATIAQGQAFSITVNGTIHDNGPDPAPVVPTVIVIVPADCVVAGSPRTLAQISLAVSTATPLPPQTFSITCANVAVDTIAAAVDAGAPMHVTDAAGGNNSASGQAIVDVRPDDDLDGVEDAADQCPGTVPGATVDPNGCSQVQVDADLDGVCDPGAPSGGPGPCAGSDNCPTTPNIDQSDVDADTVGDVCDNCVSVANGNQLNTDAAVTPPGDALGDECDPDDDNDGYFDTAEDYVGTDGLAPCGGGSSTWPADFISEGQSINRVTLTDLASFVAPVRYFETNIGDVPGNVRWDLVPGHGSYPKDINLQDLGSLVTVRPPWMGGARAFDGPVCPFAQ